MPDPAVIPEHLISASRHRFNTVELNTFKRYDSWLRQQGYCIESTGPDVGATAHKKSLHASAQRQHKQANAKTTAEPLLSTTLSEEEHVQAALRLPHPFTTAALLETDLDFATSASAEMGMNIAAFRSTMMSHTRRLHYAAQPIDNWIKANRICKATEGLSPMFTAMTIVIMDWPDTTLPGRLASGFELVGDIVDSHVFRPQQPHKINFNPEELLGPPAIAFVDELEADLRNHPHGLDILAATTEEVNLGLATGPFTRASLDHQYGRGQWRPLPRHMVYQDGKARPIDDGKRAGHNAAATLHESISCTAAEILPIMARAVMQKQAGLRSAGEPATSQLAFGNEDRWNGFRQMQPSEHDRRFCIITFVHPDTKTRTYYQLLGLPFGVGSVVNQFNRLPQVITAWLRRQLGIMASHYFDDSVHMDWLPLCPQTKTTVLRLNAFFGIVLSTKKRKPMRPMGTFLGRLIDMTRINADGATMFEGKPTTCARALGMMQLALQADRLTASDASKLRGLIQWLNSAIDGKP